MHWLKRLFGRAEPSESTITENELTQPWEGSRPSIFHFLVSFELESEGRLPDAASTLPDEQMVMNRSGTQLQWAAGATGWSFGPPL